MINSMDLILKGRLLGSGRVPLIHFDIAKFQMSDRVTRQFGFMQGIPSQPKITGTLEKRKKKLRSRIAWTYLALGGIHGSSKRTSV